MRAPDSESAARRCALPLGLTLGLHLLPVLVWLGRPAPAPRDRYTSPDGVVIYRARQGRRETSRQTGSVNFLPGGAAGGNLAGAVPCPKNARWQRY